MQKRKIRGYHPLDLTIRQTLDAGMEDGTLLTIEYIYGFELWGAYETWRGGYRVSGRGIKYEAMHLEDAVNGWAAKVKQAQGQTWITKRQ